MIHYGNKSGNSGVLSYETGDAFILVTFTGGETYRYTYRSAGKRRVETMKKLAAKGEGLSTFISREAHDRYEK